MTDGSTRMMFDEGLPDSREVLACVWIRLMPRITSLRSRNNTRERENSRAGHGDLRHAREAAIMPGTISSLLPNGRGIKRHQFFYLRHGNSRFTIHPQAYETHCSAWHSGMVAIITFLHGNNDAGTQTMNRQLSIMKSTERLTNTGRTLPLYFLNSTCWADRKGNILLPSTRLFHLNRQRGPRSS